jgi:hypothetical protein
MKLRWKIALAALLIVALGPVGVLWQGNSAQKGVRETRRALQQQGFKTELAEFSIGLTPGQQFRTTSLTNAGQACRDMPRGGLALMQPIGTNTALVIWKQDKWETPFSEDALPEWRTELRRQRAPIEAACIAALSGPISFQPVTNPNGTVLLPHLSGVKALAQTLAARTLVDLHDANHEAAWSNLLALTRLVTAWKPEPAEVSHLVRFACLTIAQGATWEALQAGGWTDAELAVLQREWASADLISGLPATAAFSRASMAALCAADRQQPVRFPPLGEFGRDLLRSPRTAWSHLASLPKQLHYRNYGSYEDETALLLYFRDREIELCRAVKSSSWLEMRGLPGVTNRTIFRGVGGSRLAAIMNLRQIALVSRGRGMGLLSRAAEAEAWRQLLVTALAIERHRLKHSTLPHALQELVPHYLPEVPRDFMNGQPVRYLVSNDGHFLLYSVGLDCVDNGGRIPPQRSERPYPPGSAFGLGNGTDLVWPKPALPSEVQAQERTPGPASAMEIEELPIPP